MEKQKVKKKPAKKEQLKQISLPKKQLEENNYFDLLGLAILICLGIIIYSNSFDCSFHFDGRRNIVNNTDLQSLSDVQDLWKNYSHSRFISYYTFAVNYNFGKLNVWGYHFVNLLIHLINACLVWWLTRLIFSSPAIKGLSIVKHKKSIAILTALLFVSHPLATESVTYIVQRMASLVTLFYLLSVALYIKARLIDKRGLRKYLLFAGSGLSLILALLSKENAYTLPFAIVLVEIFLLQTGKLSINFRNYRGYLFLAAIAGFISFILYNFSFSVFNPIQPDSTNDFNMVSSQNYFFTQFSVILKYFQLLILPLNQNLDPDFPLSNSFFELRTMISFSILLALFILATSLFKKNRLVSFGFFWFFLTISIESSIIPLSDLIVEHRTYLPSFGFFLILSSGIYGLLWNKYKYVAIAIFIAIIGSNSYLTYERNKVWKDPFSLWNDIVSKSPNKARAYNNRGAIFNDKKMYKEALDDLNKAIELQPQYGMAYYNRGMLFGQIKRYDEAIADLNKTIEITPNSAILYYQRGTFYGDAKRYEEALKDYIEAIKLDSNYFNAYINRGNILMQEKRYEEALLDYNKAIKLNSSDAKSYNNRANLFNVTNQYDEALMDYNKAIELNPFSVKAYSNRGALLIKLKRIDDALKDYNRVIELKPDNPEAYLELGAVYFNEANYEFAIRNFSKAIELRTDFSDAYYNRGLSEFNSGKKESACKDWGHAQRLGHQSARDAIRQFCK